MYVCGFYLGIPVVGMIIVVTVIVVIAIIVIGVVAVPVGILIRDPLVHAQNWTNMLNYENGRGCEILIHSPTHIGDG